jgi:hypothetical protein
MFKRKAGLQKEVSKIFTGIQIPGKNVPEADSSPASPVPAPVKHDKPKQISPAPATPDPVKQEKPKLVSPTPAVPASAKQDKPKLIPSVSRPSTITQPKQNIPSVPPPTPKVYEPPVPVQKVYEPPATKQQSYMSPALSRSPGKQQLKPELLPRFSKRIPGSKIVDKLFGKFLASKPGTNTSKQKAMILLMPVLLIVFIFVLTRSLRTPAPRLTKDTDKNDASLSMVFNGKIDWELPSVYPDNIRDPMVFGSSTQKKEEPDRPVVKGIVFSEDNPCAVVGDRIVTEGDVVQGATVIKINSDSVEFRKGDETWIQKVER